jgi:hypothetical protein
MGPTPFLNLPGPQLAVPAATPKRLGSWGRVAVDPPLYQVLKTNIKLDIELTAAVAAQLQTSSPSFGAALVCDTLSNKEYVFKGGVELQKVQVKKSAAHFKILINPISKLKKELAYCEDLPLNPADRKLRPRFWIRFYFGQETPIDTTKFYLFIRRDEQREHARGGAEEDEELSNGSEEDGKMTNSEEDGDTTSRQSGDSDSAPERGRKRQAPSSVSSSSTEVPASEDDLTPSPKRRAVENLAGLIVPKSESLLPPMMQSASQLQVNMNLPPVAPWLAAAHAMNQSGPIASRLANSCGPAMELSHFNRLSGAQSPFSASSTSGSPSNASADWKKSSSGSVPNVPSHLPMELFAGTPPAPLYSSTLPRPQATTLQHILQQQHHLYETHSKLPALSASAPPTGPAWNTAFSAPNMMPRPEQMPILPSQSHTRAAVPAPSDLLSLSRNPDPVQICTQVIKPHITVKINRSILSAMQISEGQVEVQLIWSCPASESALDKLGGQPLPTTMEDIRNAAPGSWRTVAVPTGLYYETNKVFFADTTALQFKHIHVNNWTTIKNFVKDQIPGGGFNVSATRERILKLNFGLRFNFKSTNNILLTWVDMPGLFTLDIRRENDPNYAKRKGAVSPAPKSQDDFGIAAPTKRSQTSTSSSPIAANDLSGLSNRDKNAIDFLVSVAASADD